MSTYTCRFICSDGRQSVEMTADDLVSLLLQIVHQVWPLTDPDPDWRLEPSLTVVIDMSGGYMLTLDANDLGRLVLDAYAYRNDPTNERREALQHTIQYLVTERFALSQDTHADLVRAVPFKEIDPTRIHKPPVA